jgi:uncharacterized protein
MAAPASMATSATITNTFARRPVPLPEGTGPGKGAPEKTFVTPPHRKTPRPNAPIGTGPAGYRAEKPRRSIAYVQVTDRDGRRNMPEDGDEEEGSEVYEMLVDPKVTIHDFGNFNFKGATVIDGFPSVGLVSTIAANYLIDMLKLKQVGIVDARHFPTLSVVHNGEPLNPVRLYAGEHKDRSGEKHKLVVFISEFQPAPHLVRPIAEAMLDWVKRVKAELVISPEGLVLEDEEETSEEGSVYAIGSTPESRKLIKTRKIEPFNHGIITGVSGVLLNIGKREKLPVISILAEAHANYPDARSAATVIETMAKLLDLEINVDPLYKEAEGFERQIMALRKQADAMERRQTTTTSPSMYG